MTAKATKLFLSNTTQAVRLPRGVAFPPDVKDVVVRTEGRSRVITPVGGGWADWFENDRGIGEDFMPTRDQGIAEERNWLE